MRTKPILLLLFIFFAIGQTLTAQIIWEDNRSMIYQFLDQVLEEEPGLMFILCLII